MALALAVAVALALAVEAVGRGLLVSLQTPLPSAS
jgi:hypothetical protein